MNGSRMQLRIAHLYAHYLNIYGDRGNLIALGKRCHWRNIDVSITCTKIGDILKPGDFDIFFIGGGQDKQQQIIAEDLQKQKFSLEKSISQGAVILSICGGYQLLGHYYKPKDGPELKGISLIDAYTLAGNKRMIGNVVIERNDKTLVGFENHSGKTFLGKGVNALGKVMTGNGNNGEDGLEGTAQVLGAGIIYGTYLHGSLLPKNPLFTDEIISKALLPRYGKIELENLDDTLETNAHKYACTLKG